MRAKRTDANHRDIMKWYRSLGCSVADTSGVGNGFPDLVVGICGHTELVEVKTAKGKLKFSQEIFRTHWSGKPLVVVRDLKDVTEHVQGLRHSHWQVVSWTAPSNVVYTETVTV